MNQRVDANEKQLLPAQFSDLLSFLKFAQPTNKDRVLVRASTPMIELQAFYDAMRPRMEGIMVYLQDYPPDEKSLEAPVRLLMFLAKAFMDVALAVELFHAPDEPNVWAVEGLKIETTY